MAVCNSNAYGYDVDTITKERINHLCDIILIFTEDIDQDECELFIKEHIDNNIQLKGDRVNIRSIVQNRIAQYVDNGSTTTLFAFASDNKFCKVYTNATKRSKCTLLQNIILLRYRRARDKFSHPCRCIACEATLPYRVG
jgi:hypothetical protein